MSGQKVLFLLCILCLCSCAYGGEKDILKQYFFFRCVNEGHSEIEFSKYDGSLGYTTDVISSGFSTIKIVSEYAKKIGRDVPVSSYNGKKSVLLQCLDEYESGDLDLVVQSAIEKAKNRKSK